MQNINIASTNQFDVALADSNTDNLSTAEGVVANASGCLGTSGCAGTFGSATGTAGTLGSLGTYGSATAVEAQ